MKSKKLLIFVIPFIILITSFIIYKIIFHNMPILNTNWNIDIPSSEKTEVIFSTIGGFPMDGISCKKLVYTQNDLDKIINIGSWTNVNNFALDKIINVIDMAKQDEKYSIKSEDLLSISKDSQYLYYSKNNNWLLLIFEKDKMQFYVIEVYY